MNKRNVFVKGVLPGVGKTTCCKQLENDKLFESPYNKLCQSLRKDGCKSITNNKLLGLVVKVDMLKIIKQLNSSEYDTIIFYEILLYNPLQLYLIKLSLWTITPTKNTFVQVISIKENHLHLVVTI